MSSSSNGLPADLYDLVVRAVIAYERDGEVALAQELAAAGDFAPHVQQHVDSMRQAGLLQEPEMPAQIGPWRVRRRLGSGGMGTVYLCDQEQPVRRRVAVKVMRAGMDSAAVLARFRLEQQALAALDHPGIARLLDAGTDDKGRPFLVMEYVAGMPLHRYCDERQLDARGRLELFALICDAVQHAHHKGIVHRDLKPSNVLVLDRDGAPWPMVIDFGVAKSIGGTPGQGTMLTMPGVMLGTPEYMSPEQALHELDIDTRADVYSLGVMLYELLTGTLPIERERLRGSDVARVLGTSEPPTPSSRITALGAAAAPIAESRRTDVAGLRRLVRGDLDWVVMKALEKDRNRRYGMPAELAADVRRFLAHEPVSAGPVSSWYRLQKLCARNRAQAVAIAAAMVTIAGGLFVSTWFWREAAASSRASDASLDDALSAVGELVAVGDSDLVDVPHLTDVRRGLLERSVAFYRRFVERADREDVRLQPRITEALLRLGCLHAHLGDHAAAVTTLRDADARAERLADGLVPLTLRVRGLDALAEAAEHQSDPATAVAATRRAETMLRRAFAKAPDDDTRADLVGALVRRSRQLAPQDKNAALAVATEARELGAAFAAPDRGDRKQWPLLIEAGAELAHRLLDLGRRDDALHELEAAFQLWQRAREGSADAGLDWRLTLAVGEIAAQFARCDNHGRMVEVLTATESTHERLVADHPAVLPYRTGLARTRRDKAVAQLKCFRFRDGVAAATAAEHDYSEALALASADVTVLRDSAHAAVFLANAHLESKRQGASFDIDLARAARERGAARIEQLAKDPVGVRSAGKLRLEERRLFALLHATPDDLEVVAALAATVALADELVAATPDDHALRERSVEMRLRYGQALRLRGDAAPAKAVLAPALEQLRSLRGVLESHESWVVRATLLLEELARVEALLGNADAVLAHLGERVEAATKEDWGGKLSVVRLLLQFAKGELQPHAARLLARAREVVRLAHEAGDIYEQRGMPDGTPAMVASMRANTWSLLVDVEQLGGDAGAEAAALGEVVACRAKAHGLAATERSLDQLRRACDAWLQRLVTAGDPATLAAAADRLVAWTPDDAAGLVAAARAFGRFVQHHPDAVAVRESGCRLLQVARQAGADPAALAADADLQPLVR